MFLSVAVFALLVPFASCRDGFKTSQPTEDSSNFQHIDINHGVASAQITPDPCLPSPCGAGAVCRSKGIAATCECRPGLRGDPRTGCSGCQTDADCSPLRCVRSRCVADRCAGVCGVGARCGVSSNFTVCTCPPGTSGDAFVRCDAVKSEQPCDPSTCAPGAVCAAGDAQCSCPAGTSGDAAGCLPTCTADADCPHHRACQRRRCEDPCAGVCGARALCRVHNHLPICSCPPRTTGDPFVQCHRLEQAVADPVPDPAIGGKPVPLVTYSAYNEIGDTISHSAITAPKDNQSYSEEHYVFASAKPSIGGMPVTRLDLSDADKHRVPFHDRLVGISSRLGGIDNKYKRPENEKAGRMTWQVSVFNKMETPYVRVCGGSLVTASAVVSAASCFWVSRALPATQFAVAAGEAVGNRDHDFGSYRHRGDVAAIKIPPSFRDEASVFQDDIAVLLMQQPFQFVGGLRPVCVSFDPVLEEQQLAVGSKGTVLSVGYSGVDRSPFLWNQEVTVAACEPGTRRHITREICATAQSDGDACSRDQGAGLAFFLDASTAPVLRGVTSARVACAAYTPVRAHRAFLLRHVRGVEEACARHYPRAAMWDESESEFVCNCYC